LKVDQGGSGETVVSARYSLCVIGDGSSKMYESVLVATDGSETAAEAVRVATELAKTFGAALHIASVYNARQRGALRVPEMKMAIPEGIDPASVAATQTEALASRARTQGVSAQTHVVSGNVAEQIVTVAEQQHADLIVVGNKGMRGLKRVLGSVPNAVAHSASCSVLIVNTT
jgi:nucleotide-binding universal stress UspA family protein